MIPPIASRFIAGETAPEALDHARRTNEAGLKVILNLLGEHYGERPEAAEDAAAYEQLLADLDGSGLDACVSVKPTQLGLAMSEEVFRHNLRRVVEAGAEHGRFVWIDMEGSEMTEATVDAYEAFAREFDGGIGLCLQANLRRTPGDIDRLADVPGKIRLVKGAYDEPAGVAYRSGERVNEAYFEDLERLFDAYGGKIAVGSHDPAMIEHAVSLGEAYDRDFEIQMLMGVRPDAQRDLAARGYEVWQYAPFGERWLSYVYRRVRERRANLKFALRAVAGV